jgi:hypothetical protein
VTRAKVAALVVLLALGVTIGACSRAPALPTDDAATYQRLTGSDGPQFLQQITSHEWDDGGAAVAARIAWIARDAQSGDDTAAQRAGKAAHAIATFLTENEAELSRLPAGWFGLTHRPAGELNPKLVRGYASALTPFLGALVGDVKNIRGFSVIGDGIDLSSARNIFAVIDSNTEAGNEFKDAAYQRVREYLRTYAEAIVRRNADNLVALQHAADLAGVVQGGQRKGGNASIETQTAQRWINWAGFEVAAALGARPGDPDIPDEYFMPDGTLKAPDQVSANDLDGFATALENFTFNHGSPSLGSDFQRWYDAAAGK